MIEELIQNGEYQEALELLNDRSDETNRYLRLVCLIALKLYEQAKIEGYSALLQAQETYYDVVSMYITALKELGEFEEAIDLLIKELSMPYIPYQYEQLFNTAYDEILLEKQEARYTVESKNQIFSIDEIEQLLKNKECNEELLYMAIDQLQQLNVRLIMPTIREYLIDPKRSFFVKTLLLEILIEQQVDEELEVEKFHEYYLIDPVDQPMVLEQSSYQEIATYLEKGLADDNPALYQQCMDFLAYYLYAIYPKTVYDEEVRIVAATIHYYVATLQFIDIEIEDLETIYYCDAYEIEEMFKEFRLFESLTH